MIQDQEELDVYFKLYFFRRPSWRFWGRPSKAAMEFRNYEVFQQLGIPCADPIACGEQRDLLGRLRRAFILTKAVPGSVTLEEFIRTQEHNQSLTADRRRNLLVQAADATRQIHEAGFFHHDLVWRNILVAPAADAWSISWIDCPRGKFIASRFRRHRSRLRDLGSFDKSAARQCNRADRLRAFLRYSRIAKLDAASKKLLRQVLEYRRTRWPDDWPI
jgi:tRNA A-37 threonylcarbamoyl transferase component Bud32